MKQIRITKVDDFTRDEFKVNNNEVYDVVSEAMCKQYYGYLINTIDNRAIVMYEQQVEVLN